MSLILFRILSAIMPVNPCRTAGLQGKMLSCEAVLFQKLSFKVCACASPRFAVVGPGPSGESRDDI